MVSGCRRPCCDLQQTAALLIRELTDAIALFAASRLPEQDASHAAAGAALHAAAKEGNLDDLMRLLEEGAPLEFVATGDVCLLTPPMPCC